MVVIQDVRLKRFQSWEGGRSVQVGEDGRKTLAAALCFGSSMLGLGPHVFG